jgi:hypothetical protein
MSWGVQVCPANVAACSETWATGAVLVVATLDNLSVSAHSLRLERWTVVLVCSSAQQRLTTALMWSCARPVLK